MAERQIQKIFKDFKHDDYQLFHAIETMAQKHGEEAYIQALHYLFAKKFSPEDARTYWLEATTELRENDDNTSSFRAVLLDYLRTKTNELEDPRIIEAHELAAIRKSAITDGLTNLFNQTHLKQSLEQAIQLAKGSKGASFSLIMFDLDHFKQYNDRCGHLEGDNAIATTADIIRDNIGKLDLAARYGGEEFTILLPDCQKDQAIHIANQIREQVAQTTFPGEERLDSGTLTISGGVASYPGSGKTVETLLAHADGKLYEAKKARNLVLPSLQESRTGIRHTFRNIVEVINPATGQFQTCLSTDISHLGLLLKSDFKPAIDAQLALHFPFPFWPHEHHTTAKVRHIDKNDSNISYLIGLEFDKPEIDFFKLLLAEENLLP